MSNPWFHLPDLPDIDGDATLDARETRHALGSKRLSSGDSVTLFDGSGGIADAVLVGDGQSRSIRARVVRRETVPEPAPPLHLAAALPKGDRQSTMLAMATQLGVTSFTPLDCRFSVARASTSFPDRAGRILIEACKQCHRPHRPQLRSSATPAGAAAWGAANCGLILVGDRDGAPFEAALLGEESQTGLLITVGPEGGFTEEERAAFIDAGARPVRVGENILRVETAAVALCAVVRACLERAST